MDETIFRKLVGSGWLERSADADGYQWSRFGFSRVMLLTMASGVYPGLRRKLIGHAFYRSKEPVLAFWQMCLASLEIEDERGAVALLESVEAFELAGGCDFPYEKKSSPRLWRRAGGGSGNWERRVEHAGSPG